MLYDYVFFKKTFNLSGKRNKLFGTDLKKTLFKNVFKAVLMMSKLVYLFVVVAKKYSTKFINEYKNKKIRKSEYFLKNFLKILLKIIINTISVYFIYSYKIYTKNIDIRIFFHHTSSDLILKSVIFYSIFLNNILGRSCRFL